MKKLLSFVLALTMMLSLMTGLSACGDSMNGDWTCRYICEDGEIEAYDDSYFEGEQLLKFSIHGDKAKAIFEMQRADLGKCYAECTYQLEESTDIEGNTIWLLTNSELGSVTGTVDESDHVDSFDEFYLSLNQTSSTATVRLFELDEMDSYYEFFK